MVIILLLAVVSGAEVPPTMKRILLPFTMLLACGALLGACGSDDDDSGGSAGTAGSAGSSGAREPKLSVIQAEIFNSKKYICSSPACHGGQETLSLKDGESYASLVNKPSEYVSGKTLVVPGDSENSVLHLVTEGPVGDAGQMPDNGVAMSEADIELIKAWIDAGAKND